MAWAVASSERPAIRHIAERPSEPREKEGNLHAQAQRDPAIELPDCALSSITHQVAERPGRFAGRDLLQDRLAGLPRHDELRMDNDVSRQLMESLEMVAEGLLDEVPFLHAGRTEIGVSLSMISLPESTFI